MKKNFSLNKDDISKNRSGKEALCNDRINAEKLQVIDSDGNNLGVLDTDQALYLAGSRGLDLVVVSETGAFNVPVAKIINLNKKLYEDKKKSSQAKKKQHEVQLKEIRFSIKIGENDLRIKVKQISNFILEGLRVKVVLVLKGREKSLKDTFGIDLFNKVEIMIQDATISSGKILNSEGNADTALGCMKIYYLKK